MKARLVFAVLLATSLILIACGADPALTSIQLTPNTASASTGGTVQFKAVGTYQHGDHPATTKDITTEATWASSSQAVATVDTSGLVTAVSSGSTTITATLSSSSGPVIGSAPFTVTGGGTSGGGHNLISIAVTPGSQTLNLLNQTAQFIAIATFDSSPLSVDMTSTATWTSSNPTVISFHSPGIARVEACPASPCNVTITASATDQNGTTKIGIATLTVNLGQTAGQHALTALNIVPSSQTLNRIDEEAQFLSFGTYSTSPTIESMTGKNVTWQSSNLNVATIDASSGVVKAVGCATSSCVTTITATALDSFGNTAFGTAALTVSPGAPTGSRTLTNITIIPGAGTQTVYSLGETAQFLAIGAFTESPVIADITKDPGITWQATDVNVATVNAAGLATAVNCPSSECKTTITARMKANQDPNATLIIGTSDLSVRPALGGSSLPSLAVYLVGAHLGTVTSTPEGINCTNVTPTEGTQCTAFFPVGTTVTLHGGSSVDGWSVNCTPVEGDPTSCNVVMNVNQTVGAIYN